MSSASVAVTAPRSRAPPVRATRALAEPGRRERHQRHHGQRREREPPVEEEQHDRRADERQRVLDERRDAVGDELVERLDVVRQPADDHAGAVALVEAEREPLQVPEELAAQVGEHALAGPAGEVRLRVAEPDPEDAGGDERDDDPAEQLRVAALDLVDRAPTRYGGASATAVAPSSERTPAPCVAL